MQSLPRAKRDKQRSQFKSVSGFLSCTADLLFLFQPRCTTGFVLSARSVTLHITPKISAELNFHSGFRLSPPRTTQVIFTNSYPFIPTPCIHRASIKHRQRASALSTYPNHPRSVSIHTSLSPPLAAQCPQRLTHLPIPLVLVQHTSLFIVQKKQ